MSDSKSARLIPVHQFLSETSAHGISRLGGNRPLHVRLFWAVSFLSLTVVFSVSFVMSVQRFSRGDSKTGFYTETAEFTFPDIFVCSLSPFSGSFSFSLSEDEAEAVRAELHSVYLALHDAIKYSGNTFWVMKSMVNSMSFQTLADKFGHRSNQTVFLAKFLGEGTKHSDGSERMITNMTDFFHPEHVRCTRISLSDSDRQLLRQSDHGIHLSMMADRFISEFPIDSNQIFFPVGSLKVYPPEWNFANGWNSFGESGLRLFLVEPGTFPAPWSTNVLLKPGVSAEIKVSMLQTNVSETDFPNKCVPESEISEVEFHNPYTPDEPYKFKYSYAYCYYRELTQRMQQLLNCTPWRHPMPSTQSDVPNCYNATGVTADEYLQKCYDVWLTKKDQNEILKSIIDSCVTQHPCSRKTFSLHTSQVDWPVESTIKNFMFLSCHGALPDILKKSVPMLNLACDTANSLLYNSNASVSDWQNLTRLVRSQLLQVRLYGEGHYSTMVQVTLDYTLLNLFAETGGLLGLYLGCSVLTLAEVLELLHNVIVLLLCKPVHRVKDSGSASRTANHLTEKKNSFETPPTEMKVEDVG